MIKLFEEASELSEITSLIVKLVSKALNFGADSRHPDALPNSSNNIEDIIALMDRAQDEMVDLKVALMGAYAVHRDKVGEDYHAVMEAVINHRRDTQSNMLGRVEKVRRMANVTLELGRISQISYDTLMRVFDQVSDDIRHTKLPVGGATIVVPPSPPSV